MAYEITCFEGSEAIKISSDDEKELTENTTLSELRSILINKCFLKKEESYRFARKKVSNNEEKDPTDIKMYNLDDEEDIPIKRLYDKTDTIKRIQIVNTKGSGKKKPDYIGEYRKTWVEDFNSSGGRSKHMTVEVRATGDEKDKKLKPVMLENVINSSTGMDRFKYTCICVEGSELYFKIGAAGECGNEYTVEIVGGDQSLGSFGSISSISDGAYKFKTGCFDRWRRGENKGKSIVIKDSEKLGILDPKIQIKYRIVNFKVNEITKWMEKNEQGDSKYYTVKDYTEKTHLKINTINYYSMGEGSTYTGNSDDEKNATLIAGENDKGLKWSSKRYYCETRPYGIISAHFFIFKDHKTAERYFKRYFSDESEG